MILSTMQAVVKAEPLSISLNLPCSLGTCWKQLISKTLQQSATGDGQLLSFKRIADHDLPSLMFLIYFNMV